MNKLILLALAASAGFGAAPAFAQDQGQDNNASYRAMSDKAQTDYKVAKAQCDASSGNAKKQCEESAKVDLARADADAVALYKNTPSALSDARLDLANAEYGLARAKCDAMSGSNKTLCLSDAKTAHTTALLPLMLAVGASVPGVPLTKLALLLSFELGIMGIITPYAFGPSPIYYGSGYIKSTDFWRLGTIFGLIFLLVFLAIGIPWTSFLLERISH